MAELLSLASGLRQGLLHNKVRQGCPTYWYHTAACLWQCQKAGLPVPRACEAFTELIGTPLFCTMPWEAGCMLVSLCFTNFWETIYLSWSTAEVPHLYVWLLPLSARTDKFSRQGCLHTWVRKPCPQTRDACLSASLALVKCDITSTKLTCLGKWPGLIIWYQTELRLQEPLPALRFAMFCVWMNPLDGFQFSSWNSRLDPSTPVLLKIVVIIWIIFVETSHRRVEVD